MSEEVTRSYRLRASCSVDNKPTEGIVYWFMKWFSWFRPTHSGASAMVAAPSEEEFLWVEGRRHLKDLPYLMPQDAREIDRLDFQHYLIRYIMQRNYVAPLQNPKGILDVGCGTGRWAIEMATMFPQTKVFGLDIHDAREWPVDSLPKNYRFIQGNVLEELPFPDMTFDFVHQRFLHVAIPFTKWSHVLQQLTRVTRVGGWVELAESDQVFRNTGPGMRQLMLWGLQWSQMRGIDARVCARLATLFQAMGLQNIHGYRVDVPVGSWAGRIGSMTATNMYAYNRAIKPRLVADLKLDPRAYDAATEAMQQEWNMYRCFFSFYIICGQRMR